MFRRNARSLLAAVVAMAGLSGCAGTPVTASLTAAPPEGLPPSMELEQVPFFPQTDYHCGPAALATVLNADGLAVTPEQLAREVYTPGRKGTFQTEIVTGARRHGRLALPLRGMPEAFRLVAEGRPVLVFQNLGLEMAPQWHYAVLVGYDLTAPNAVLRSGMMQRRVIPLKTLEHTWRRTGFWGIAVADPAGPVPETATLAGWLQEAHGLERVERPLDAMEAYRTAADHWPDEAEPLISLANMFLGEDRLFEATRSLQSAVAREPDNAIALNNLAHVLMLQEEWDEAETAALAAVKLGGPTQETARETLKNIQRLKRAE